MNKIGFVCFGEVNTPFDQLEKKHDHALDELDVLNADIVDAGIVVDDPEYQTADRAIDELSSLDLSSLIVCLAGWVPSHAVIRVTDVFRHLPMVLWGLSGWKENSKLVTTADQAGTTALRFVFEVMKYQFKYVYSVIDKEEPMEKIRVFTTAAHAAKRLRASHVGTMGYRDMLLYGTQFDGNTLRREIGVEVEPFEMLEMVQNIDSLNEQKIQEGVDYVKNNWVIDGDCDDSVIDQGVKYALAVGKKIEERNFDAISLNDVDGMKKLEKFPPAIVFMLLEHYYDIPTIPETDILGAVTQLIMKYVSGQNAPYVEFYEFFDESMLVGVPDYIPPSATEGDITLLPTGFGSFSASLVNISKLKTGFVTCARLYNKDGKYYMHLFTANAKPPMAWEECGWGSPAPQLPSLEIFPDSCSVEAFAQKVASQHVIIGYGDFTDELRDLCNLLDIEIV